MGGYWPSFYSRKPEEEVTNNPVEVVVVEKTKTSEEEVPGTSSMEEFIHMSKTPPLQPQKFTVDEEESQGMSLSPVTSTSEIFKDPAPAQLRPLPPIPYPPLTDSGSDFVDHE